MSWSLTNPGFREAVVNGHSEDSSITIATRHATYGYSTGTNGGKYHKVARVFIQWEDGKPIHVGASWVCPSRSQAVVLVHEVPEGAPYCPRCPSPAYDDVPSVYLARVGDRLKVGQTKSLALRMTALGGDLIDAYPGGPDTERRILALTPEPCEGREWFSMKDAQAVREAFDAVRASQQEAS